jgi:hypothetical protein
MCPGTDRSQAARLLFPRSRLNLQATEPPATESHRKTPKAGRLEASLALLACRVRHRARHEGCRPREWGSRARCTDGSDGPARRLWPPMAACRVGHRRASRQGGYRAAGQPGSRAAGVVCIGGGVCIVCLSFFSFLGRQALAAGRATRRTNLTAQTPGTLGL